jgi:tellurite resistance protein TerC
MFRDRHPLLHITYKWARRIAITVVGFTVLGVGIAMIVLPGPAIIVIPVGLGILGLEFAWARLWLKKIKERGNTIVQSMRRKRPPP